MVVTKIRQSVGTRFILATFFSLAVLVFFSYVFSAWYMVDSTQEKLLEDYESAMEFTVKQIDRYQEDIVLFSGLICADSKLQKIMNELEDLSEPEKIKKSIETFEILRNYELFRNDCVGIQIIMNNGDVYTSDSYNKTSLRVTGDDLWYEKTLEREEKRLFLEPHVLNIKNNQYDNVITYCCDIGNYYSNKEKCGKLLLHLQQSTFDDMVYKVDSDSSWCAILNSDGDVLAESGKKREEVKVYLEELTEEQKVLQLDEGWILYNNELDCGLQFVMYMSKDRLHDEERGIFLFYAMLFLICLIVTVLVIIPVSRGVSKPIKALSHAARQVSEGHLDVHIKAESSDEIGTLTEIFNHMTSSLETQMKTIKQAEREKADLKMDILMAQINPHFIYNTLNSAIYLSKVGENRKAERLLQLFILILQNNMKSGPEGIITTLEGEVRYVQDYIELQKIRYPERFDFILNVDPELYYQSIPRLMLQPLIENALNHGVLVREFGTIELNIWQENNYLYFQVKDDGEGMDEDVLDAVKEKTKTNYKRSSAKIHSISIENICQRLELFYKNQYRFEIKSVVNEGTEILISFPIEFVSLEGGSYEEKNTN